MGSNTASFTGRVAAILVRASVCMFYVRMILLTTNLLSLFKFACTFERYRIMRSSLASYYPKICSMTSWESPHISNLVADKVRARFNPTRITSYFSLLLEASNPSLIAYSNCSLVGDCKRRPISALENPNALST